MTIELNFENESLINIQTEVEYKRYSTFWSDDYIGHIIETDKRIIRLGVSNHSSCCEQYGAFEAGLRLAATFPDRYGKVKLLSIKEATIPAEFIHKDMVYFISPESEGGFITVKVTFEVDDVEEYLYLAIYNSHNGYYAHEAALDTFEKHEEYVTSL